MFASPLTATPSPICVEHRYAFHHLPVMSESLHQIRMKQFHGVMQSSLQPKRWVDSAAIGGHRIRNRLPHVALMFPPSMSGTLQILHTLNYLQQNIGIQQQVHRMLQCHFTSSLLHQQFHSRWSFQAIGNISTPFLGIAQASLRKLKHATRRRSIFTRLIQLPGRPRLFSQTPMTRGLN